MGADWKARPFAKAAKAAKLDSDDASTATEASTSSTSACVPRGAVPKRWSKKCAFIDECDAQTAEKIVDVPVDKHIDAPHEMIADAPDVKRIGFPQATSFDAIAEVPNEHA